MTYLGPAVFALFLWWFTTGVIFYLDSRPRSTFKWSMGGATLLLVLAGFGLSLTAQRTDEASAYLAFASGLIAWGWQELSLYTQCPLLVMRINGPYSDFAERDPYKSKLNWLLFLISLGLRLGCFARLPSVS